MICFLRLFKNIKEGGKGTRMIQFPIYHKFKFIINLVNLIFLGEQEFILREQQITGRLLVFSVSASNLNVETSRE